MGTKPPNWQWCQGATQGERVKHFVDTQNSRRRRVHGFSCLANLQRPKCSKHDVDKKCIDRSIAFVKEKPTACLEDGDVEVLLLTHSNQQLDSENVDIPGLKICNLNELDIDPKYSDNKWAESRIYLADIDKLFKKESKIIGTLTGSWSTKYHKHYDIYDFINWDALPYVLDNDKNVVLCAVCDCMCSWTGNKGDSRKVVFDIIFSDFDKSLMFEFLELIDIEPKLGICAISNQFVSKRNDYRNLHSFFNKEDIIPKVDFFCKKNEHKMRPNNEYFSKRIPAYWCEFASIVWQMSQDFLFLPCGHVDSRWYREKPMQKRSDEWV